LTTQCCQAEHAQCGALSAQHVLHHRDSCSVHPMRRRRARALDGASGALANHGEIRFPLTATSFVKQRSVIEP
jgi:hypothetical protein